MVALCNPPPTLEQVAGGLQQQQPASRQTIAETEGPIDGSTEVDSAQGTADAQRSELSAATATEAQYRSPGELLDVRLNISPENEQDDGNSRSTVVSEPSASPIVRQIKTDGATGDVSISLLLPGEERPMRQDKTLEVRVSICGKPEEIEKAAHQGPKIAAPSFSLPLLVRTVGAILACSAGLVNSVAFFELGSFVSHQTGNFSKVGFGDTEALGLLMSFLGGSIACGLIIGKDTVHVGLELYDFGLLGIAGLLVTATFSHHEPHAKYFAAAACGLQNSMATFWGGAVVRTTHVTGLFTDLGLLIGRLGSQLIRMCMGHRPRPTDRAEIADNLRKGSFLGTLALAFLLGVVIGKHVHESIHEYAFLLPACVVSVLGVAYMINRVVILKQRLFAVP